MAFDLEFPDFSSIGDALKGFFSDYGMEAGIGAQGVGTWLRSQSNRRVAEAQAQRAAEEAARQRVIQQQITERTAATVPQFSAQQQEALRQGIAQKYASYITPKASAEPMDYVLGADIAPKEVKDAAAAKFAQASEKGKAYASGLADQTSTAGLDLTNRVALNNAGRDVGLAMDASRGSSAILPYELAGARRAGKNLNIASDVANGLGTISFLYGATAPKAAPVKPPPAGTGIRVPDYLSMTGGGGTGVTPGRGGTGVRVPRLY